MSYRNRASQTRNDHCFQHVEDRLISTSSQTLSFRDSQLLPPKPARDITSLYCIIDTLCIAIYAEFPNLWNFFFATTINFNADPAAGLQTQLCNLFVCARDKPG
jgi:hypothetical protein